MHFSSLGLADWISDDSRYFEGFKRQIRSWICANPFEKGVNWACPMDVALRAVNWLNAIQLFKRRIEVDSDEEFYKEFVESLWLHGRHIMRNLEWSGPKTRRGGNHLLADITGLRGLGCFFKFSNNNGVDKSKKCLYSPV